MKDQIPKLSGALALLALFTLNLQLSIAFAQGTAFTYQGRLNSGGSPANGSYDLAFTLFATNASGVAIAGPVTNAAVSVSNGLFTTTVDFGNAFTGGSNWLQIAVSTNGANNFFTLAPRQQLTPVPYAIMANSASNLLGSVSVAQLGTGTAAINISGNAATATSATTATTATTATSATTATTANNALTLGGLTATNFWQTGGNAGTTPGVNFIGTTDHQPLEFRVSNQRALRFEPASNSGGNQSINVIGGYSGNFLAVGVVGATIAGGGETNAQFGDNSPNSVTSDYGTVGGGIRNTAGGGFYAIVAGGSDNNAGNQNSTVGGGRANTASGDTGTIAGGYRNAASALWATVGGGNLNTASGQASVVGGGSSNQATTNNATVPGGANNIAGGQYSFAAGNHAQATNDGAFVWADSQNAPSTSTANDQFLIRAQGGVGIGTTTPAASLDVNGSGHFAGNVGIGTPTPAAPLEIRDSGGRNLVMSGPGGAEWSFFDTSASSYDWDISGGPVNFTISNSGIGYPFTISRLSGNVGIGNPSPGHLLVVGNSGSPAYCDGTTWQNGSDRNSKQDFAVINPAEVLKKVAAMPITEWQYKAAPGQEHLGPMAQDFHAAFGLNGGDDKHISTVDEGGVALAAIQGLNEKLEGRRQKSEGQIAELKAANAELQRKNDSLEKRLARLEQIILKQKSN